MSVITVENETLLPEDGTYVRCGIDPYRLSGPKYGHNYVRADGAPWRHAGYRVDKGVARAASVVEGFGDPGEKVARDFWATLEAK